jgi:hypothetical protein
MTRSQRCVPRRRRQPPELLTVLPWATAQQITAHLQAAGHPGCTITHVQDTAAGIAIADLELEGAIEGELVRREVEV